jgi:hypothetical protein
VFVEKAREDVVVAVGEDGGRDLHAIIEEAARWSTSAVDLRLYLFDNNSLTTFDWLHRLVSPGALCGVLWIVRFIYSADGFV